MGANSSRGPRFARENAPDSGKWYPTSWLSWGLRSCAFESHAFRQNARVAKTVKRPTATRSIRRFDSGSALHGHQSDTGFAEAVCKTVRVSGAVQVRIL